jgi:dTDP-4-amino-4,6-dideoxygalactose transaminase
MIKFYDTSRIPKEIVEQFTSGFRKVCDEDSFIDGIECQKFNEAFAKYTGSTFALGVANGLDALSLSLRALGIGIGSRVAVPAHTFIATWLAVANVGAEPVGVDVDEGAQISVEGLLELDDLDAVIIVHMHGNHGQVRQVRDFCDSRKIPLVEDCAQAHGLKIDGKMAGNWGDIAAFSFYPTKNLFAFGDGGAITTNNSLLYERVRQISRYGSIKENKYQHAKFGLNSRLDTIQAAWLITALEYLESWNERRRILALRYKEILNPLVEALPVHEGSVYHHFVIFHDNRDELRDFLTRNGVRTEVHYPINPATEFGNKSSEFNYANMISKRTLSLPLNQWLDEIDIEIVANTVNSFYAKG